VECCKVSLADGRYSLPLSENPEYHPLVSNNVVTVHPGGPFGYTAFQPEFEIVKFYTGL
jgi:hypothetical protein